MLWIILIVISGLSVVLGIILSIIANEKKWKFDFEPMCKLGLPFVFIFAIFGGINSLVMISSELFPSYSETASLHSSVEIENMQDNRDVNGEVSGNLFYTKGQENTEYYYYFMKKENDTLIPDKIKATDTKLKYINDEKPHIDTYVYFEETTKEYSEKEIFWFAFKSLVAPAFEEKQTKEKSYQIAYYELYVPKDSVSHEFDIDLK